MADDIVGRFDSIKIFAKDKRLAPHKPLLLLYALAELKNKKRERIDFNDAEKTVGPLIRQYGSFNTQARVAYPFERLANDKGNIWWIEPHQTNASGDLSSTEARDQHLNAGFSDDVLAAFRQNPAVNRQRCHHNLLRLHQYFVVMACFVAAIQPGYPANLEIYAQLTHSGAQGWLIGAE